MRLNSNSKCASRLPKMIICFVFKRIYDNRCVLTTTLLHYCLVKHCIVLFQVFVQDNDVYYRSSMLDVHVTEAFRVTDDGIPDEIFNGVPDWVFEGTVYFILTGKCRSITHLHINHPWSLS